MASHIIDSVFFRDLFGTAEMRNVFSDDSLLQRWLDCESALARAEARFGVVPVEAAEEITRKARRDLIDPDAIERGIAETVHPIMPVIRALAELCDGDAGQYVHWGATTQDIMDSAVALQLKEAHRLLEAQMDRVDNALVELAVRYRETPMAGRTHGQHAVPITFGFKVAVWLSEWRRHRTRLSQCAQRVLVGELSGAAGTLAGLPDVGLAVQDAFCRELGLGRPDIAWHTARDAIAEWCFVLALVSGTCGKIAHEIISLQKDEVGELAEPHNDGKVGSSTMPHKRNPMLCEAVMALAQLVKGNANTALGGLAHEHERDMGPWQAEWQYVPEATVNTAGCLEITTRVLVGLEVRPAAMARNLELTGGLICSEALMIRLGETIGRQRAHDVVYKVSMLAHETGVPFVTAALDCAEIKAVLSEEQVKELLEPRQYLGWATAFVDQVVAGQSVTSPLVL